MIPPRPFEQQSTLERTLRAHLWTPTDRLARAREAFPSHVRKKEYQAAADCQTTIRKAEHEIGKWQHLIDLYYEECVELASNPQSQETK